MTSPVNALPDNRDWFEYYTAGILRPDQGTVELTATLTKPADELGNAYDFLFKLLPAEDIGANTLMGLVMPTAYHPTPGLNFVMRNYKTTGLASWPGFTPKKGEPLRLAFSWGKGMRLYVNGRLVAQADHAEPMAPMSPLFRVHLGAPFHVSSLKISSVALSKDQLTSDVATDFTRDENTTLLASDHLRSVSSYATPWHRESDFAQVTPIWEPDSQVFLVGESVRYPVVGVNRSPKMQSFQITQTITSAASKEKTECRHEWDLAPGESPQLHEFLLPDLRGPGYYRLETKITSAVSKEVVWKSAISILPTKPGKAELGSLSTYLGHHYEADCAPQGSKIMNRIGIRTLRVDGFQWNNVEPEQGHFDWRTTDRRVEEMEGAGQEILAILGNPPRWAAEPPAAGTGGQQHEYAAMPTRWKPRNIKEWEAYVFAVASRYRGRVKYWEIWNEVDFHPPGKPASFSGSTEDYRQLLQSAFTQIRRADPSARVLTSGFSLTPSVCDTAMPYDLLAAGAGEYFDIFNIHGYNGLQYLDKLQTALDQYKLGAPKWMTEQMWLTITNEKSRLYNSVALPIWFLEKGYERFYAFGFYGPFTFSGTAFDSYTQSPHPDFHVFGILQSNLERSERFTGRVTFPGDEDFSLRHSFALTDGRVLTVLGSQLGRQRITFSNEIESASDQWGSPIPLVKSGSNTTLDVPDLAYVTSREPLRISETLALESAPLYANGGFEDVLGDVAAAGLEAGRPEHWVYREKDKDPDGRIVLSEDAHTGKYGLKIQSSGKGAVYAFQDVSLPKAGTYRLSAWLRKSDPSSSAQAYLSVFDREANKVYSHSINMPSSSGWEKQTFDVTIPGISQKQVAIIVGVEKGGGSIVFDDVTFEVAEDHAIPLDQARPLDLTPVATHPLNASLPPATPEFATLPLDTLRRVGSGLVVIGGVPFRLSNNDKVPSLVMVSSPPRPGVTQNSGALPLNFQVLQLAFLHTAMCVKALPEERIGEYLVEYSDGSSVSIPLLNDQALRDWFLSSNPKGLAPAKTIQSEASTEYGVFVTLWNNPYPQKILRSLSMRADGDTILCLLAVTAKNSVTAACSPQPK